MQRLSFGTSLDRARLSYQVCRHALAMLLRKSSNTSLIRPSPHYSCATLSSFSFKTTGVTSDEEVANPYSDLVTARGEQHQPKSHCTRTLERTVVERRVGVDDLVLLERTTVSVVLGSRQRKTYQKRRKQHTNRLLVVEVHSKLLDDLPRLVHQRRLEVLVQLGDRLGRSP